MISSLYVCMAIKHIIVLFVETPRKFITAVINLRGVFTNKTIIIILNINTSECWLIQSYSLLYFNRVENQSIFTRSGNIFVFTILTLNLLKMLPVFNT
jgi:hypothetical protein